MKIRDDSERSLARACYVFERIMHGKWNFCYLVSIITMVWSRNRNMTFIITIKAIITVREISWLTTDLTCQDFKKRVHLYKNSSFDSGQKELGVNSYLQVISILSEECCVLADNVYITCDSCKFLSNENT